MIQLMRQEGDSGQFIEIVEGMLNGAVRESSPNHVYVVKIDKWFPAKWCEFSGKQHGAIGIWKSRLTLPPFAPSRVVIEDHYELSTEKSGYIQMIPQKPVHLRHASSENLKRFVDRFDSGAAIFWYSGATEETGKGCLMAYIPTSEGYSTWYAEVLLRGQAKLGMLRGISKQELICYAEA